MAIDVVDVVDVPHGSSEDTQLMWLARAQSVHR